MLHSFVSERLSSNSAHCLRWENNSGKVSQPVPSQGNIHLRLHYWLGNLHKISGATLPTQSNRCHSGRGKIKVIFGDLSWVGLSCRTGDPGSLWTAKDLVYFMYNSMPIVCKFPQGHISVPALWETVKTSAKAEQCSFWDQWWGQTPN